MTEVINDFISFLRNYFRNCTAERARLHGCKRSLIRRIGSALPLKAPPRMRIPLKIRESFVNSLMRKRLDLDQSPTADRLKTIPSTSLPKPDFLLDVYQRTQESSPVVKNYQGEEIITLQQKVQMLEDLVNKILLTQNSSTCSIVSGPNYDANQFSCPNPAKLTESGAISSAVPSIPPPPPPPLPGLFPISNKLVISKKLNQIKETATPSRPSMGEVLKDLNKIKLRHVERSPGGGPIKRQMEPNSPGGCLAAVLRKRFEAIQTKPDDSFDDCDSDDSANSFQSSKTEACH